MESQRRLGWPLRQSSNWVGGPLRPLRPLRPLHPSCTRSVSVLSSRLSLDYGPLATTRVRRVGDSTAGPPAPAPTNTPQGCLSIVALAKAPPPVVTVHRSSPAPPVSGAGADMVVQRVQAPQPLCWTSQRVQPQRFSNPAEPRSRGGTASRGPGHRMQRGERAGWHGPWPLPTERGAFRSG